MAARTEKSNTDDPFEGAVEVCVDQQPINLDPPKPALKRWEELAERELSIEHNGDAEAIMPFPRPEWADPDRDIVGRSRLVTCYESNAAWVPLGQQPGKSDSEVWFPAGIYVCAKIYSDRGQVIGFSINDVDFGTGEWKTPVAVNMTAGEAVDLANVLLAAVELLGETEKDAQPESPPTVWYGSGPQVDAKVSRTEANYLDAAHKFIDSAQFYLGGIVDEMTGARRTRAQEVLDRIDAAMADLERLQAATA